MSGSITTFSQAGDNANPSPSIWADCPNTLLNDKSLGHFMHEDFLATPLINTTITAALLARIMIGQMSISGDADTVVTAKASEVGGYVDLETDGDDNDAVALFTEPFGTITKNSGKKFWFEARFEIGDVAGDYGLFVGVAEEAAASLDVVADDAGALIGESYIGARVLTADPDGLDIAYKKDAGTEVVVLEDATNATAIPTADRASLVNDTEVKFGFRFDGRETLYFYINGVQVATQAVDTTIDQSKNYCAVIGLKTGAAAAESIAIDWVRIAAQDKSG